MSFAHKIRVGVLRGGPSSEYEVSLKSGETVLKNLPSKYEGVDIFISQNGTWHVRGGEKSPADALKNIDVVFVALHGQYGEDGKVQHILEHLGVPYTGSESFPSAIAMNKHLAKGALKGLKDKVKFAAHKMFSRKDVEEKGAHEIFRQIHQPAIVKPNSAGSSVGVTIVKNFFDLETALTEALKHSDTIIIEELIEGREATCGVLDNFRGEKEYAFIPEGNLGEDTKKAIQDAAKAVHRELGLRHYSFSDFMIHPKRGVFFLEANTLPKLTSESLLPKSAKAIGLSMSDFLDHVLTLAML